METTSASTNSWFRRHRFAVLGWGGIILFTLLLVSYTQFQNWRSRQKMAAQLAAIRAQGLPASTAELNAWYVEPPVNQNAATIYLSAFPLMVGIPPTGPWFDSYSKSNILSRTNPIPALARAELARVISSNQNALKLLYEGSQLSTARYPVNLTAGYNTLLPHATQLRDAVRLLCLESLHHTVENHPQAAIDSLIVSLKAASSLSDEPTLISHLVQIAGYFTTCTALENILNRTALPPSLLKPLLMELETAENALNLPRAMTGERAMALEIFNNSQRIAKASFEQSLISSFYEITGLNEQDFALHTVLMEQSIAASGKPAEQITAAFAEVDKALRIQVADAKLRLRITRITIPALLKAGERNVTARAYLRLARAALLLHIYQSEHAGDLPENLTSIPGIPLDPFDASPLRYRKTATGFDLWSIGPDGLDNDGKPRKKGSYKDDYDILFTVEKAPSP
ncbi:MAG TPA: hypothetical protein VGH19_17605 [Verrucomicrobiae bacterium]